MKSANYGLLHLLTILMRKRKFVSASLALTAVLLVLARGVEAQIPGLPPIRVPHIPGLPNGIKIPGLPADFIPRPNDEPVSTNIKDVRGEVPFLDGFNPTRFKSLNSLKRGPNGGWLLKPGLYYANIRSYCLHAGTYGPTKGNGYSYAPLKGKRAGIITKILHNSADHPEIPQSDAQSLIWAIEARTKVSAMFPNLQRTASTLLTNADILDLNGTSVQHYEDMLLGKVYGKMDAMLAPVLKAQNDLRGALTAAVNTPYKQLEKIAVLNGDPPKDKNDRDIPGGRWIMRPEGFFERFIPSGYSQTRLEIYVPGNSCVIKRDAKGRIVSVTDEAGNRVETDYNDTTSPLVTTAKGLQGYTFASIRFTTPQRKTPREWKNVGWTFTGLPVGKNVSIGNAVDFPGSEARLQAAMSVLHETDDFRKQNGKNHKGAWADVSDVVDLASYRAGIEDALKAAKPSGTKPVTMLSEAWQASMMTWAKNSSADNDMPLHSGKKKKGVASLMLVSQDPISDTGTPAAAPSAAPSAIEYDPSTDVAVPGSTGRQRLGLSELPVGTSRPDLNPNYDLAKDAIKGSLGSCFRQMYGDQDNFWSQGNLEGGHSYLAVNSIGKFAISPIEAMRLLKQNIETLFPAGARGLDGSAVKLNRRFTVTTELPGPSNVKCTYDALSQFVFHTITGQHVLRGQVTFGIFKDSCGELWLFQQGRGEPDENVLRAWFNYETAPILWEKMADTLREFLSESEEFDGGGGSSGGGGASGGF